MSDMNLKTAYASMTQARQPYNNFAANIAALTLPSLVMSNRLAGTETRDPRTQTVQSQPEPYTPIGTQAVRSLASSILKAMFGVKSFALDLSERDWETLRNDPKVGENGIVQWRKKLEARENSIQQALSQKMAKSRFASAKRRNLVEGTTGYLNLPDRIKIYPLHCMVVEREAGQPRIVIFQEEITPDPLRAEASDASSPPKSQKFQYLCANYETGEVWMQDEDEAPVRLDNHDDPAKRISIHQFIVSVGEIPDIYDYPVGYAYNYLRAFAELNNMASGLGEACALAATNWPLLRPGSLLAENPQLLAQRKSGQPIVGNEGDVSWVSANALLSQWSFVVELMKLREQGISISFAMGIKDRPMTGDTTATEILQIIDELNTQTQDLLSTYEETEHRPLIESELYLQDLVDPLFPELAGESATAATIIVKVQITSGANAIERQRALSRLILQELPSIQKMDPNFRVNGKNCADAMVESSRIKDSNLYSEASLEEQMAILQAQMAEIQAKQQQGQNGAAGQPARSETVMTNGGPQIAQGKGTPLNNQPAMAGR